MGRAEPRLKKMPIGRAEPKFGPIFCTHWPIFRAKIESDQKID